MRGMKLNNKENARSIAISKQQNKLISTFNTEVKKYGAQHYKRAETAHNSLMANYAKHGVNKKYW